MTPDPEPSPRRSSPPRLGRPLATVGLTESTTETTASEYASSRLASSFERCPTGPSGSSDLAETTSITPGIMPPVVGDAHGCSGDSQTRSGPPRPYQHDAVVPRDRACGAPQAGDFLRLHHASQTRAVHLLQPGRAPAAHCRLSRPRARRRGAGLADSWVKSG